VQQFLNLPPHYARQVATLYSEYLPTYIRGRAVMTLSFYWAFGALFLALLAWAVMPTLGWRWLIGLSTIPITCFVILSPIILPESPLYLASTGQKEKVQEQLNKV
jgi:MFS family permease